MAKTVTRKNLKQFGVNGNSNNFGQFGSVEEGSPLKTKDVDLIQALSAWLTGWQDAVVDSNKAPFLEDMNGIMYVMIYNLFYLLQEGTPEWDDETTYFIGSTVRKPGTKEIYQSLTDDNLNNALPVQTDNINWSFMSPVRFSTLVGQIANSQLPNDVVEEDNISDNAVTNSKIADLAVSDEKISGIDADKIAGILAVISGGTGTNLMLINTVTYTGDGNSGRTVAHGMGAVPDMLVIWAYTDTTTIAPLLWQHIDGSSGRRSTGQLNTVDVQDITSTNVILSGSNLVNGNGIRYLLLSLRGQL